MKPQRGSISSGFRITRRLMDVVIVLLLGSCATQPMPREPRPNPDLTQGNVQLHLVVGETTKAEVLEVFGAPNITTRDGAGRETWSYQRAAEVTTSSTTGFWVVFARGRSSLYTSRRRRRPASLSESVY